MIYSFKNEYIFKSLTQTRVQVSCRPYRQNRYHLISPCFLLRLKKKRVDRSQRVFDYGTKSSQATTSFPVNWENVVLWTDDILLPVQVDIPKKHWSVSAWKLGKVFSIRMVLSLNILSLFKRLFLRRIRNKDLSEQWPFWVMIFRNKKKKLEIMNCRNKNLSDLKTSIDRVFGKMTFQNKTRWEK